MGFGTVLLNFGQKAWK